MTTVYVVTNFAVIGVYTDPELALKVKKMSGYDASVSEIEIDHIWPGHILTAEALGMAFSDEQLQRKAQAKG